MTSTDSLTSVLGSPREISYASIYRDMTEIEGVVSVHSLHIWALTMDRNSISVHLAIGR